MNPMRLSDLNPWPTIRRMMLGGSYAPHMWITTRVILIAAITGVVSGIGALLFHTILQFTLHHTLTAAAGYSSPGPLGEAEFFEFHPHEIIPWMLVLVPMIGGLISGVIVYTFAPEAEGHGTDSAVDAYHNKRGLIRWQVPIIKMIASAITMGTGGSGGREGPIAQIGAGFGSVLATRFGLSDIERRVIMAAGLGAGIGAIFHAPLAGAIFAVEVLYRDPEFEAEALIPSLIATTIAYCIFNVLISIVGLQFGYSFSIFGDMFALGSEMQFRDPMLLIPITILAFVMVALSWLFVRTFYGINWLFKRWTIRNWIKPGIGGAMTGITALLLYYIMIAAHSQGMVEPQAKQQVLGVLSSGYGFLQEILLSTDGSGLMIAVLLAVGLGKILTTSLTIGSGGSGGVFGPSMVIGGTIGAVVGLVFQKIMPETVGRVDMFILLGMAGFFAAAANTPISTLIMVSELTGGYELLLPSMWVCALSYMFSRGWSIYCEQVGSRRDSPAHRGDFIVDVLKGMTVEQVLTDMHRVFTSVPLNMPLSEIVRMLPVTKQACFPVIDRDGNFYGLFGINDVRQFLYDSPLGDLAVAQDLASQGVEPLETSADLGSAIGRFASDRFNELPVTDPANPTKVIAMIRRVDVIAAYNAQLMQHIQTDKTN